jgi:hypothetical protein
MGIFSITVIRWQITPRCTRAQNPEHGVNKAPGIFRNTAATVHAGRQMGFQKKPHSI